MLVVPYVWQTSNGGIDWHPRFLPYSSLFARGLRVSYDHVLPNKVFISGFGSGSGITGFVWKSTDGGETWDPGMRSDIPNVLLADLTGSGNVVYAGGWNPRQTLFGDQEEDIWLMEC